MAAIEIPDAYWTMRPRGFVELAAQFSDVFDAARQDLIQRAAPVLNGNDGDLVASLATTDAESPAIRSDAAGDVTALVTTPTGQIIAAYGTGDARTSDADAKASVGGQFHPGVAFPLGPPPDVPPDVQRPPPPDSGGAPDVPPPSGGGNPGGADVVAIRSAITGMYEGLLNREPDEGGLDNWTNEVVANGHTIDWVQMQIMASDEYRSLHAPPPAPPAPPVDTSGYVTHEQLVEVLNSIDPVINILV